MSQKPRRIKESQAEVLVGTFRAAESEGGFVSQSEDNGYFPKIWPAQLITKVLLWT